MMTHRTMINKHSTTDLHLTPVLSEVSTGPQVDSVDRDNRYGCVNNGRLGSCAGKISACTPPVVRFRVRIGLDLRLGLESRKVSELEYVSVRARLPHSVQWRGTDEIFSHVLSFP